jgi:hypothetical protein
LGGTAFSRSPRVSSGARWRGCAMAL